MCPLFSEKGESIAFESLKRTNKKLFTEECSMYTLNYRERWLRQRKKRPDLCSQYEAGSDALSYSETRLTAKYLLAVRLNTV